VTYVSVSQRALFGSGGQLGGGNRAGKDTLVRSRRTDSGYPDCRPAYYEAFNEVVKTGTKEGRIEIVTPLIAMRKAEIVRLGP